MLIGEARYAHVFSPIRVGGVTIPNRIVRSAHGTLLTGEAAIAYHEARARGGVGMITLEATGVHRLVATQVPLWSDDVLPYYREISQRIHAHGTVLFQQIYHAGASYGARGAESWGASAIPNYQQGVVPFAMTAGQIAEVIDAFAAAARRCRDGGLDGVDIHASSGYLIHEFLSPALNQRDDAYGGSFEKRLRFLLEIIAAVRDAVDDPGFVVGVRLPNEDHTPGGLDAATVAEIAARIDPLVDYVSLHMGSYWRFHTLIAPTDAPLGVEMPANRPIVARVTKPTIVVGRINTIDHAEAIIRDGEADMVSMVRALLADPDLVNKSRRGDEARIRPCIGTNIGCVGQIMSGHPLSCVVNPAAARERLITFEPADRAARPKRVLIVGGGPAGLEAARTARLRGHELILHEASERLRGQVAIAASAPHRADVGAIVSFLIDEVTALGVSVHTGSLIDAERVALARNEALPLFTMDYQYQVLGDDSGLAAAYGNLGDADPFIASVNASIPLGNEARRARLSQAITRRLQRLATKESRVQTITQEVHDAVDNVRGAWRRVVAARLESRFAERTLLAEQRQFDVGLRTSVEVLDANARVADAQSREVEAAAQYETSLVDLAFATGTVLGEAQVTMPGPMPVPNPDRTFDWER